MRAVLLSLLLAALPAAGCGNGAAAPARPPYPPETAFAVNGLAVGALEVDAAARLARPIYPLDALDQLRRRALHELVIPRAVCRTRFAADRERALESARAVLEREREQAPAAGGPPAPPARAAGNAAALGPFVFGPASELALGAWSDPIELVGRFVLVRLDGRESGAQPGGDVLSLSIRELPYVPPETSSAEVEAWIDASTLEIVDPAWEDVLTAEYKHRMRAEP